MQVITFYSYKGGVGRTLALANIAQRLANDFGKTVAMIDFDLEAPGLHHKFEHGLNKPITKGLVDYIYEYSVNGRIETSIKPFTSIVQKEYRNTKPIHIIPAGNTSSNDYWKKLAAIDWHELFYKPHSQGVNFILNLKNQIQQEINPDFLLIDSRTGITEISGITISLLADSCIILSVNNDESILGSKQVINSIKNPENKLFKNPDIHFVLTRIPFSLDSDIRGREIKLVESLKKRLNLPIVHVLHSDPDLEWRENLKIGYPTQKGKVPIGQEYLSLFEAIIHPHLKEKDFDLFAKIKEIENLMKLAVESEDSNNQIELYSKILEIDKNNFDALEARAELYFELKKFRKALEDYTKLGKRYLKKQAECLQNLGEYNVALEIVNKLYSKPIRDESLYELKYQLLDKSEAKQEEMDAFFMEWENNVTKTAQFYNSRANWLLERNLYEKSIEDASKAIGIDVKYALAYATLAEANSALENDEVFFMNLELAFVFGLKNYISEITNIPTTIYRKYKNNGRFINLLKQYNIEAEFMNLLK